MKAFWLFITSVSFILWFGNPFSYAWFAPYSLQIDLIRGFTPLLLLLSLSCAFKLRKPLFIICSGLFILLVSQNLFFYFNPPIKINQASLTAFCSVDMSKFEAISKSTEPNVVAESWLVNGKIIGRVCLKDSLSTSLYNEAYRSIRRFASSIRHRTEEKIIITYLQLPVLARLYAILEEVSKTSQANTLEFSLSSLTFPAPFLFTSDSASDPHLLIDSLISGKLSQL